MRLSAWIALRCKEPTFWKFLKVENEASAIHEVKKLCSVSSRAEFDRDPDAEERLHAVIRRPFRDFTHHQEQHP